MSRMIIDIVTTSRADYGLLYPLIHEVLKDDFFELNLLVTGSHLSVEHGYTIELIRQDGIPITEVISNTIEGDTETDVCSLVSNGLKGFSKIFNQKKPDILIVLGDRYELWSACMAAVIHKVPIAHIHGGEVTEGAIDEFIRHSITKMAIFHFPSTSIYAKRIIQMGESPDRVYTVGALGIDNIKKMKLMDIDSLSEFTGINFRKPVALLTYHPVTIDSYCSASEQIYQILDALTESEVFTLATMPNADAGNKAIADAIVKVSTLMPHKFKLIKNLGQRAYLSAMKHSRLMIGNTSSGIIESASFRIPVVNVGDRQRGRLKPANVIDCVCSKETVKSSIETALSEDFLNSIKDLENPYGSGNTSEIIVEKLKKLDLENKTSLLKKKFYDLAFDF